MFPLLLAALAIQLPPEAGGPVPPPMSGQLIVPQDAVQRAAEAAPGVVPGTFVLTVKASGRDRRGRLYLNSERDYRDQRNLSIEVMPAAAAALEARNAQLPEDFFVGRTLLVRGAARRVRIDFSYDGQQTGLYYYQTHVVVTQPDQIQVVPSP